MVKAIVKMLWVGAMTAQMDAGQSIFDETEHSWFSLTRVTDLGAALRQLEETSFDVVVAALSAASPSEGLNVVRQLRAAFPVVPVIAAADQEDEALAARVLQAGAQDFFPTQAMTPAWLRYAVLSARERQRAQLRQEEQGQLAQGLATLVTLALGQHISHNIVFDQVLHEARRLVSYTAAHIMLLEGDHVHVARSVGYQVFGCASFATGASHRLADLPLAADVIDSREPVVLADTHTEPRWVNFDDAAWIRSAIIMPIRLNHYVFGLLTLHSSVVGHFDDADADRLHLLVDAAAVAIENAQLYRETLDERSGREQAEVALQEKEEHLRQIIDLVPHMIFVKERGGRFLLVNQAVADAYESTVEQLTGQLHAEFHPLQDEARRYADDDLEVIISRQPKVIPEETFQDIAGNQRVLHITKIPFETRSVPEPAVLSVALDITRQRQVEQSQNEQRVLAEALVASGAVINSTLELDTVLGGILIAMARVVSHDASSIMLIESGMAHVARCRGFGRPGAEETALALRLHISEDPILLQMIESGHPVIISDTHQHPDWIRIPELDWIRSHVAAPIYVGSQVIGFLNLDSTRLNAFTSQHAERLQIFANQAAIAINNAQLFEKTRQYAEELERRVAERTSELHQTTRWFDAILENAPAAIYIKDLDGRYLLANHLCEMLFQRQKSDLLGKTDHELLPGDVADPLVANDRKVLDMRVPLRFEEVLIRGNNPHTYLSVKFALYDTSGAPYAVCGISTDITRQKQAEAKLLEEFEKEKDLNKLKLRFVMMASHEFRTPLAVIQATADLLTTYGDRFSDEEKANRAAKIQLQVKRLIQLLDDMLTMGRMEAQAMEFEPEQLELTAFVAPIIDEVQNAFQTHTLTLDAGEPIMMDADKKLVRKIVTNLLSNAIKYSSEGSEVAIALTASDDQAVIHVTDHGIGIPEADQVFLFDAFHRARNVGHVVGAGLGLTITKQAVEMHGGTITCQSAVGVGSTFTVVIPMTQQNR